MFVLWAFGFWLLGFVLVGFLLLAEFGVGGFDFVLFYLGDVVETTL